MEILPVSYIDIRLDHTVSDNEPGTFGEVIKKCLKIANRPGLKNTFSDDERNLIVKIARGLNIEQGETLYE